MIIYVALVEHIKMLNTHQQQLKMKQEVGDNLIVCALNLPAKVSTLPGLLVITLVIVEI